MRNNITSRAAPRPGMRQAAVVTGSLADAGFLIFVHMPREQKNSCGLTLGFLSLELPQGLPLNGLTALFVNTRALAYNNKIRVSPSPGFTGSEVWDERLSFVSLSWVYTCFPGFQSKVLWTLRRNWSAEMDSPCDHQGSDFMDNNSLAVICWQGPLSHSVFRGRTSGWDSPHYTLFV